MTSLQNIVTSLANIVTSLTEHCDVTGKHCDVTGKHCDVTSKTLWRHCQNIVTSLAKHCDVTGKTLWRHGQNIVTSLADWSQNVQEFAETFDIFQSKWIITPRHLMIRANDTRNKEPLLSGKAQYHWPPRTNHCDQLLFSENFIYLFLQTKLP